MCSNNVRAMKSRVKFGRECRRSDLLDATPRKLAQEGLPGHRNQERQTENRLELAKTAQNGERDLGFEANEKSHARIEDKPAPCHTCCSQSCDPVIEEISD